MHVPAQISLGLISFGTIVAAGSQGCGNSAKEIGGNWYCSAVEQIHYTNFGTPGHYNQITHMGADGSCKSTAKTFSGPLAPLNGEVSLHFRGPIALKQFASYTLSRSKRDLSQLRGRHYGHARYHARHATAEAEPAMESRAEDGLAKRQDWVTATIDGKVVSWINNYFGPGAAPTPAAVPVAVPAPAKAPAPAAIAPAAAPVKVEGLAAIEKPTVEKPAVPKPGVAGTTPGKIATGAYTRSGYYDSKSQSLDGLTFLGNHGGAGSGVFDYNFGASLAYLNAAGTGGTSSSQVLADTTIGSNTEFTIMTNKPCGDKGCGYVRPGTVAYHGFDGADKVFLFEFNMPKDGSNGFNADMPAIWMLNAEIPRTLQYGKAECSCWTTGCGEFDIVEVLSPGSEYCKSTLHTNTPGGDSDYIARPTSGTMKLAVVFSGDNSDAVIQVLPNDTVFGESLTAAQVKAFTTTTPSEKKSLFAISS